MSANVVKLPPPVEPAVKIGANYTGKQGFADTRTGEYWEVLPAIEGDDLKIQQALLQHARDKRLRRFPN